MDLRVPTYLMSDLDMSEMRDPMYSDMVDALRCVVRDGWWVRCQQRWWW